MECMGYICIEHVYSTYTYHDIIFSQFYIIIIDKSCVCPQSPSNGSASCKEGDEVSSGSRVTFKCQDGFHMVGSSSASCYPSGYWSEAIPICEKGKYRTFES